MNKQKLGQDAAFPRTGYSDPEKGNGTNYDTEPHRGMSKRLLIAMNLTAARISSGKDINDLEATIRMHYEIADKLLIQENE
jgi:hypothetical protein